MSSLPSARCSTDRALYEDMIAGRISEQNFNTMLEKTQTEQAELKAKVSEGRKRLSDEVQLANDAKQWVEAIQEYANITELDSATLNRLIKEIVVHERRMQYQCAVQGYRRRRDTNAYYAAMYLLTSNDDIYRRTANCFCKDGIEFGYAVLKNTSPHNYALFMAARDLCDKTEAVTMADLAEPEVIDPEALRLIVNATLIARYGLAAFQIRARGADYER